MPAHRPATRSTPHKLAVLAVTASVALGACSTGDNASTAAGGSPAETEALSVDADPLALAPADEAAGGTGATGTGGGVDLVAATQGRQIISTAFVDLEADDADGVARAVADLVAEVGGFIAGEDTSRVDGTRTTLVIRVPPAAFDAVLDDLGDLAELTGQRIETDEVTEQVVDLRSRITTAEASVIRLRALLDRTGKIAEIAQVETELLARETTLETLRGQLRTIERQVDLATITVTIDSDDTAPVIDESGDDRPSFLGGLTTGWDSLVIAFAGLAAMVGVLLPWLVVAALIGFPLRRVIRSRRRPATATL